MREPGRVELPRIIEVMQMIQADMPEDIKALDGRPFSGLVVAEAFGNVMATLSPLAAAVEECARILDEEAR